MKRKEEIRVQVFEISIIMLIVLSFTVLLMFASAKYLIVSFNCWVVNTNISDSKRDLEIYGASDERLEDYKKYKEQENELISNNDIARFLYTCEDTATGRVVKLILQLTTPCIIAGGFWLLYEVGAIMFLIISKRPWEKSHKKVTS